MEESEPSTIHLKLVEGMDAIFPLVLEDSPQRSALVELADDFPEETNDAVFWHVGRFDQLCWLDDGS
ncbi:MAG: hypothetical protein PVF54_05390 [Anaerolineae bacterium]|jgi:hypothetical protein